jgi:hypothetical protein
VTDIARFPLLFGIVLGSVTVIAVAAGLLDVMFRTDEAERLLAAVEDSEATMYAFDDEVTELFIAYGHALDELEGPGLLDPSSAPEAAALYAEIDAEVSEIARTRRAELSAAVGAVRGLGLLPWHTDLDDARHDYLAHADTWLAFFTDLTAEPERLGEPRPEIDATFFAAGDAMRRAVPSWADSELHRRVEEIFADPTDAGETA